MSLNTNYYFFISCNAETDCFLFPVLPEKVTYSDGIKNTSLTISIQYLFQADSQRI